MNKNLLTFIVLVAIVGGIFLIMNGRGDKAEPVQTDQVSMTAEGFSPQDILVTKGTTVTFTNNGDGEPWPASAVHPTHTVYPNSDINKCFDNDESNNALIFDACGEIAAGDNYTFTFTEVGEWRYHNHLAPSQTGSVTVTE